MNAMQNKFVEDDGVTITGYDEISGYSTFQLGNFKFSRDEYFAKVTREAKGQEHSHLMSEHASLLQS
ncbi:hydroxyquinol 1,2-dioxygenase, partial [Acinetobacter baumannii]